MSTQMDSSIVPGASPEALPRLVSGPPPVIAGEEPEAYEDLHARMVAALKPADPIEDIYVRDVADIDWDIARLRRLKARLLAISGCQGMTEVLRGLGEDHPLVLARRWAAREPTAIGDVKERLANAGLGTDAVMAGALAARITEYEKIERLLAEARRAAALDAIEGRRAARLRAAAQPIEREVTDAEFAEVAPGSPACPALR